MNFIKFVYLSLGACFSSLFDLVENIYVCIDRWWSVFWPGFHGEKMLTRSFVSSLYSLNAWKTPFRMLLITVLYFIEFIKFRSVRKKNSKMWNTHVCVPSQNLGWIHIILLRRSKSISFQFIRLQKNKNKLHNLQSLQNKAMENCWKFTIDYYHFQYSNHCHWTCHWVEITQFGSNATRKKIMCDNYSLNWYLSI